MARLSTLLLVIAGLSMSLPRAAHAQASPMPAERSALVVDVAGAIGPATTEYLRHALASAGARGAAVVVLRLDTPGGLASSTRDIVRDILASPVPVIGYVAPSGARAASAGTYILYACHLAAMAPGTSLGAATPIQLGGGLPGGSGKDDKGGESPADAAAAKAVNDAAAFIRGLAELRGRDADWGEEAVRQAASLSAGAALERRVVEIVANDVGDLLAKAQGRRVGVGGRTVTLDTAGLTPVVERPGWRTALLGVITDPNMAYILLLVGIYGIILEFMNPGTVVPGVVGSIALLVGLFAFNLLPVNYAGLGLILLGMALLAMEAMAPTFILGAGGIVAFALGSLLLFNEQSGIAVSPLVVAASTAVTAVLFAVMLAAVVRAHRRRPVTGGEAMVGEPGTVLSWAGVRGEVRVHGERWQARAVGAVPLAPGRRVRVTGRDRLVLLVAPDGGREPDGERP
ncbi:NfeD family protein [Chelatococcus reniformis]|nr:nodulation protein NfeD [Chelatococcus reniformis]